MLFNNSWKALCDSLEIVQADIEHNPDLCPSNEICLLLILGEDHRFYNHIGVDFVSICRAIWKTIICRERQGGSTIAMQLVRTLTRNYEKTAYRKFREIVLAIRLTRHIIKDRIPTIYIWVAYYGSGMNNFQQACSKLGIKTNSINDMESSELVARLKYPEPRICSKKRRLQIRTRAQHLLELRKKTNLKYPIESDNGSIPNCNANSWAH